LSRSQGPGRLLTDIIALEVKQAEPINHGFNGHKHNKCPTKTRKIYREWLTTKHVGGGVNDEKRLLG
jgi:hypothetical protein